MTIATLDLGTSRVKAALWDAKSGRCLGSEQAPISLHCQGLSAVQRLGDIEEAWVFCLDRLTQRQALAHWSCLAVCCQRGGIVEQNGEVLRTWMDRRPAVDRPSQMSLLGWCLRRMGAEAVETCQTAPPNCLLPIVQSGHRAGFFRGGPPVIVGGGDKNFEFLGAGVCDQHTRAISFGTALSLGCLWSRQQQVPDRCFHQPSPIPGLTQVEFGIPFGGAIWSWLRQLLRWNGRSAPNSQLGAESPLFIATVAGSLAEPGASGAIVGLRPGCGPQDVALAALEGLIYELKLQLPFGLLEGCLRLTGGGAKWGPAPQWMADILGVAVERLADDDCSLRGLACLALVALEHLDWTEACRRMRAGVRRRYLPRQELWWQERWLRYQVAREQLSR